MKKVLSLFRNSYIRNKGYVLTNIIIVLVGILVIVLSLLAEAGSNCRTIVLSIGTSIVAASIVSFFDMLRGENARRFDEEISEIVVTGGIERIYHRRDLEEYSNLVKKAEKSIDVMGYSLKGFYDSNKDIILKKCKKKGKFHVRIILVDPKSQFSINRDVEENEQGSHIFQETYKNLLKWSKKSDKIQIRLINAPMSDMLYRIDDVMFTGPYFYRISSKETYTNRLNCHGWLYKAYQKNFDEMWSKAKIVENS